MTEAEAMNVLVRSGAKWVDEALRDNPDGPVMMTTVRTRTEIEYEVIVGILDDCCTKARCIWSKTVAFGHDDRHHAGGAAFVEVSREQDAVAFAALELLEGRR